MLIGPRWYGARLGYGYEGSGNPLRTGGGVVGSYAQTIQINGLFGDTAEWDDDGFWGEGDPIYDGLDAPTVAASQFNVGVGTWNGMCTNGWQLFIGNTSGAVACYDYNGTLIETKDLGAEIHSLGSDGSNLYAGFSDGLISQYDMGWNKIQDVITLPAKVSGLAWSENSLWATDETATLYEIDVAGKTYISEAFNASNPTGIVVLADTVITNDLNGDLYALSRNNLTGARLWTQATGVFVFAAVVYDEANSRLWYLQQNGEVLNAGVSTAGNEPWSDNFLFL